MWARALYEVLNPLVQTGRSAVLMWPGSPRGNTHVRRTGSSTGPDHRALDHRDKAADPQAGPPEDREQIIARRRAAQGEWHAARRRLERAARSLAEAYSAASARGVREMRSRLDLAREEERLARSVYHTVAQETGQLLSRLERLAPERGR